MTPDDFAEKARSTLLLQPDLQTTMPAMCWVKLQLTREALRLSHRNSSITTEIFLLNDRRLIDQLLATRAENTHKISELVAKLESRCNSPEEKQLLAAIKDVRAPYVASYVRALHLLVDENKHEAARAIMVQETTPAFFRYHDAWNNFVRFQMNQMDKSSQRACLISQS